MGLSPILILRDSNKKKIKNKKKKMKKTIYYRNKIIKQLIYPKDKKWIQQPRSVN